MLLALDVGNTNIVIGFLDASGIRNIARLETDRDKTAHDYAISLRQVIEFSGIAPEDVDGAILSSVVPPINGALVAAVRMITGIRPLVVGPGMKTGLNIALDLFCILTLGWGVLGAAVATVVSQGVSAALCFAYMHRHFEILRSTRDERRFRSRHARTLLAIGLPMGLQFSITAIGSIMLQSANNALGSACVAAFTAGVRIKMFVISPFESLGMAMATYTGHNYGAVKPERIWQGIKVAAGLMLGYALFAFVVLMAGSDLLARPLIDPPPGGIFLRWPGPIFCLRGGLYNERSERNRVAPFP